MQRQWPPVGSLTGGGGDLSLSVGLFVAPDCVVDVVDDGFSNFPLRVCASG